MGYFTLASGAHTALRLSGFPPLSGVPFSLTVYTSYATNTVKGDLYLGGLVGKNTGSIKASYAAVEMTGNSSSQYAGGLVGDNQGTIEASYATSTVAGYRYLGGLAGKNTGSIKASYAAVAVTGSASSEAYEELTEAYRRERAAHRRTKRMARTLGVVADTLFALLAVGILVTWRLFT